jgi:hypothetical protein
MELMLSAAVSPVSRSASGLLTHHHFGQGGPLAKRRRRCPRLRLQAGLSTHLREC